MDTIVATITGESGETKTISNWTTFTFDSDFFLPCDAFSMTLEDSNIQQLIQGIKEGDKIQLKINDNIQCTGYIEHISHNYGRTGNSVAINGRNKLGLLSDNGINPFIQSAINPESTYAQIFDSVLKPFGWSSDNGTIQETDDGINQQAKSGGKAGLAVKRGTRGFTKSLKSQCNKQLKPNKGEGYLGFIIRLCNRNGWYIRLSGDGKTIMIFPPTYNRTISDEYTLTHFKVDSSDESHTFSLDNNILNCNLQQTIQRQPSAIIAQCNAFGGTGLFRAQDHKIIVVNDILGYDNNGEILGADSNKDFHIVDKNNSLNDLIDYMNSKGSQLVPPNSDLQKEIQPDLVNNHIIPYSFNLTQIPMRVEYFYDERAGTAEELKFRAVQKMWQYQTDCFSLHYTVDGFTNNGKVWTNNSMVRVTDENLNINGVYWIAKTTFNKSRSGGTTTSLVLNLPYIYQ